MHRPPGQTSATEPDDRPTAFRVLDLTIDEAAREVRRCGSVLDVEPKVLDLLLLLWRHRERLVTKDEILDALWEGRAVGDAVIARAVHSARKLLGAPDAIKTYYGRGYRLTADEQPMPPPGTAGAQASSPIGGLIGRNEELVVAVESLEASLRGQGRILAVTGEAGIGKTTLCERIASLAADREVTVVWGRCSEMPGVPAYWPFIQVFRKLLELSSPSARERLLDEHPGVQDLVTSLAFTSPAFVGDGEQARFRFFDSVTRFVGSRASQGPLVIIFDDLHRADTPSFLLFNFLARELRDVGVLLVAAYRDAEMRSDAARLRSLGELASGRATRTVQLGGLGRADVEHFVERATGAKPSDHTLDYLLSQTAGNPFYISQLVHAPRTHSDDKERPHDGALPASVGDAMESHLSALPGDTRRALDAASVVGKEFDLCVLAVVLAVDDVDVLRRLEPALAAHFVTILDAGEKRFRFVHVLIRDVLYDRLGPTARSDLHRAVGEALEKLGEPEGALSSELSYHFGHASGPGDTQKAVRYAAMAGELALRRLAYEDATQQLESALASHDRAPQQDDALACDLLLKLAIAQTRSGELASARRFFQRAAELARRVGAPEKLADVALELAPGFFSLETGVVDEYMLDRLEEAIAALGPEDSLLRLRLLARTAIALYWSHATERRSKLCAEVSRMAARLGTAEARLHALEANHAALWSPENLTERLHWSEALLGLSAKLNDAPSMLVNLSFRIADLLESGAMDDVRMHVQSFRLLAEQTRQPECLWMAEAYEHMLALTRGEFARVVQFGMRSVDLGKRLKYHNAVQTGGCHLVLALGEIGGVEALIPSLETYMQTYPTAPWGSAYTLACMRTHDKARTRRALDATLASLPNLPRSLSWVSATMVLCEAAAYLEAAPQGEDLYRLLTPLASRNVTIGYGIAAAGSLERYLGLAALAMRRWDIAVAHLDRALKQNEELALLPYSAHTRRELGQALLARSRSGDVPRARALLHESAGIAGRLGMTWLANQVRETEALGERRRAPG